MKNNKRLPNIDLGKFKNIINSDILDKVANRNHPMANMPYYPKNSEPDKLYEEILIENRVKSILEAYSRINDDISNYGISLNIAKYNMYISKLENNNLGKIIALCEYIVRKEYNIDEDEVIFDLDIINHFSTEKISLPDDLDLEKDIPDTIDYAGNYDLIKKRTINALSQGAAISNHYIFHFYNKEFNDINPKLIESYQNSLISNDLFYYMISDGSFKNILGMIVNTNNASYTKIRFENGKPVIEVRAINGPNLIHEMVKGLISLFSVPGIQNMSQEVVDETDYVMAELWDIRFGVELWSKFHSVIDINDYDIKKLIFIELFKLESDYFCEVFMKSVLGDQKEAKSIVSNISKQIKNDILLYNLDH